MNDIASYVLLKIVFFLGVTGFGTGYVKGAIAVFMAGHIDNWAKFIIAPITSIISGAMSAINFIMFPWIPIVLLFGFFSGSDRLNKFINPFYLNWEYKNRY